MMQIDQENVQRRATKQVPGLYNMEYHWEIEATEPTKTSFPSPTRRHRGSQDPEQDHVVFIPEHPDKDTHKLDTVNCRHQEVCLQEHSGQHL